MNLQAIIQRLAEVDKEIRAAQTNEELDKLETEKKDLLARKAELEAIEQRKQTALDIAAGTVTGTHIDHRGLIPQTNKLEGMSPEEVRGTEEYRTAFLKSLQGRSLTEIEKRANEMGSADVPGIIPTETQNRIFSKLKQDAPLLGEVTLFNVPGNLTVSVENANADAEIHAENTLITPAADSMSAVTLGGYEIVKVNRISATVSAMAISAFESWLTDNLSRKLARKIAAYIIYGTGTNQPTGIDYSATWTDASNAVAWASTSPTPAELVELVSYLKGGYSDNAKFLMNSRTLWGKIVAVQDNSKYKIVTDDYKRLLGFPILLDDNVVNDDIFFGNFREGIVANLSAPIRVESSRESGFLYNAIDYRATTLFDCKPTHGEAFVKAAPLLTAGA